jgi:MipA family protein
MRILKQVAAIAFCAPIPAVAATPDSKENRAEEYPADDTVAVTSVTEEAIAIEKQAAEKREARRDYFTVGFGAGSVPSYTGSDKNVVIPAVVIRGRVSGYSFTSRGVNLAVDVIKQTRGETVDFKFGPQINIRNERSARIKDAQVAALGKLDRTFEVGLWGGIAKTGVVTGKYDQIGARVSVLKDVLGNHKSTIISTSLEYGTPLSKTAYLGLQATATYVGKGYGRYYYNVGPAGSAASGLAAYDAAGQKGGLSKYSLSFAGVKSLSGNLRKGFSLVAGGQYGRVLGRYARSPIVRDAGSANQWSGGVGVAYSF